MNPLNQELKDCVNSENNGLRSILKENLTLDEKLTAIYTEALRDEYFCHYKPIMPPICPSGWLDEYTIYQSADRNEKPEMWKDMVLRHSGYIKAQQNMIAENMSHKNFLKDMKEHFLKFGLLVYAEKCHKRLIEFERSFA